MNNKHFLNHISDYVLDLLPPGDRLALEQHVAVCGRCRLALQQEREIGQLVRTVVAAAAQPNSGRLRQLMPSPPRQRSFWYSALWQKGLAAACLLLVLFIGSFGLQTGGQRAFWDQPSTATSISVTATFTTAPTATNTNIPPTNTAVAHSGQLSAPQDQPIIIPSATPIAATNTHLNS